MDTKRWQALVSAATKRRMSQYRLGEIAEIVRDANGMWGVQIETLTREIIEKDDHIAALSARVAALEAERDAANAAAESLAQSEAEARDALSTARAALGRNADRYGFLEKAYRDTLRDLWSHPEFPRSVFRWVGDNLEAWTGEKPS